MEISRVQVSGEGSTHATEAVQVKRAIEDAIAQAGIPRDLVRVTRSVYSDIRGEYVVTVDAAGEKSSHWLRGPREGKAVAEGVMQAYYRRFPEAEGLAMGP